MESTVYRIQGSLPHLLLYNVELDQSYTEPVFVDLLRRPGIDSQPGGPVRNPSCRTGPPGYIGWRNRFPRNRFLGSINVYKSGLWTLLQYSSVQLRTLQRFISGPHLRYIKHDLRVLGTPHWKLLKLPSSPLYERNIAGSDQRLITSVDHH
jgi:hypothetical protein